MGPMPPRQNKWVSGWAGVATPGLQADLGGCVWGGVVYIALQTGDRQVGRQTDGGELVRHTMNSRQLITPCQGYWAVFLLPATGTNQLGFSTSQPSLHPTVEPRVPSHRR